ncbi:YqjK-like family protein [Polynucleobacter paludilacus]|uniref:YqjK family protein n=1 Tax=Polynucleobacter paludilacus TaxID=1855895 RepID=UPI001BFD593F|nr:YqjK-like family protein [Polynucleobacter paludilacus]QWD86312.1 YqjK-like family protein [Polynucleobacter paludilacus]
MSRSLETLLARQHVLQAQAAKERQQISSHFTVLKKPFSLADKGLEAVQFIKSSPILWTSAFAVLAHFKPKLASKVLALGWGAMKLFKTAKTLF